MSLEKIVWSSNANLDLINIYNYISKNSVFYARKTINNIIIKTEHLSLFPYMGRVSLQYSQENYRELIYKSYIILYIIESNKIHIISVLHSARKRDNF